MSVQRWTKKGKKVSNTEKPPFIDNSGSISFNELKSFMIENEVDDSAREFLTNVWQWVVQYDGPMSIYLLAERCDVTVHGIRNRLEKHLKTGLFRKVKVKKEGTKRPVAHYRFHCVHNDDKPIEGKVLPNFTPSKEMMIDDNRQRVFSDSRIDDLICTSLFSALLFKTPRKPLEVPLETKVNWFETPVKVITRSETGKPVASVSDLRYYIAILSYCYELVREAVKADLPIQNAFALDMQDIHLLMGRKNEGGNIAVGLNALNRLASTVFEIPHMPESILKRFDARLEDGFEKIQPLHDFSCYWSGESNYRKKTIVKFGLPMVVFNGMLMDQFLFRVNPRIFSEESDVIIGFHLWCRRRIGVKAKTINTTMKKLHLDVAPTLKFKEFEDKFFGGLLNVFNSNMKINKPGIIIKDNKKSSDLGPNDEFIEILDEKSKKNNIIQMCNIDVYGYKVMRTKTDQILIYQNPEDDYVGIESSHNQAINRRRRELMDEAESMPTETAEDLDAFEKTVQETLDL